MLPQLTSELEVLVLYMTPAQLASDSQLADLLARLDDSERERYQRFRFDEDRHTYLIAHALVRTALGQLAGVQPHTLRFGEAEHGRPEPSEPAQARAFRCNLSHTRGLVACAFSRGPDVGVDVESITRDVELLGVAERVFSDSELRGLRVLDGQAQRERFFDLWTLKEAYIKAIGKGLSAPLRQITFHPAAADPVAITFGDVGHDDASSWCMRRFSPGPDHKLAVAFRGTDPNAVRCVQLSVADLFTA